MNRLVVEQAELSVQGRPLFGPLDFAVEPGRVTAVLGPSGSGKSSLLAWLAGILPGAIEARGNARIGDEELNGKPPESRRLGLMFQDPLLFPHLDVCGNLLFGMPHGGSRSARRRRAEAALDSLGLAGFGDRDPATLSGGQKTRVALLRVLLSEPLALLLDEPFSALDENARGKTREIVFAEALRRGLPTLLVTHDRQDVAAAGGPVIEIAGNGH